MIKKEGAFLFVLVLLTYALSAYTGSKTIWVKDVTKRFKTDKRTHIDLDLPDHLTFDCSRGSDAFTLNLERNHYINPNTDIYFVQQVKHGQLRMVKSQTLAKENVAYYQDMENGASMTVRCVKRSTEPCYRVINGYMRIGDRSYELHPAESDVTSRNVFEVPGLGKRYIVRDIANTRKANSVVNEDVGSVDETTEEQGRKDRFRRLHGRRVMFSSQHITGVDVMSAMSSDSDSDDGKEKTRWLKKKYYVDVAVLVDSSVWNLHASTVKSTSILKTKDNVKRKIREFYSHIINSVNLLYKGINDSSISIRVILSAFIFFQHAALFPHDSSVVTRINGTTRIAICPYHNDISKWDMKYGKNFQPPFNHAMLFTDHDLYRDSFEENEVCGLSWHGEVCNPGRRTSVVQTYDYDLTVRRAAHELGHNLGAFHDGVEDAHNCNPDDLFLMSPIQEYSTPYKNYTRNKYLFSGCSVESFKKTLKQKECVKTKGQVYNKTEWKQYVAKKPGEVYSPNEQCQLIKGPKSVYCGTVPEEICHLMRCKDPITRKCPPIYYNAATGTECGNFRWCFEGRCVPYSSK